MQALTPFPSARPDCLVWYAGDPCDQLIQQYQQASLRRQQQEWKDSVSAQFEKRIADQQELITQQKTQIANLQFKVDSQTMEALRSEARNQAVLDSIGVIIGIGIAFVLVLTFFRKISRGSAPPEPERTRAASA